MIKETYVKKYEDQSKTESDNKFLREDDDYVLKNYKPLSAKAMRRLSQKHFNQFVEDIMINRKVTSLLYSSNAQIEIEHYLKTKKVCEMNSIRPIKKKSYTGASNIVKNRSRKEAYVQIRSEVKEFNDNKQTTIINLKKSNEKKYLLFKSQNQKEKEIYYEPMKSNRRKEFLKSFVSLRNKYNFYKGVDPVIVDSTILQTDNSLTSSKDRVFYSDRKKFALPDIKLNLDDVYSRLYHNTVNLSNSMITNTNTNSRTNTKRDSIAPNVSQSWQRKRRNTVHFSSFTDQDGSTDGHASQGRRHRPNFDLKKVMKSSNGKEFTVKVTDDLIKSCIFKYSSGPEVIKMRKEHLLDDIKKEKVFRDDEIDFYQIVTEEGNYLLHIVTMENLPEMAKYFLDKGANPNVQNANGDTPLHIAAREKNKELILLLLEFGADIEVVNAKNEIAYELTSVELKKLFKMEKTNRENKEKFKNSKSIVEPPQQ